MVSGLLRETIPEYPPSVVPSIDLDYLFAEMLQRGLVERVGHSGGAQHAERARCRWGGTASRKHT